MDFKKRYDNLNQAQKLAVDTIDGPVMVIAGPGTGKTELLSVRVANILQKTDTLPENILCLTFTDSGANAMRERLTKIIGKEAYKVAIHTFHSFGTEVINQNGQFFYQGSHFRAADQLDSYEIIHKIFEELDYNNPLAGKINDEYTYLSDSLSAISDLKKSGLTSDELISILDENNIVIEKVEQLLSPIFDEKISKKTADRLEKLIKNIQNINEKKLFSTVPLLSQVIADSLKIATDKAIINSSTKPITAWRNEWFKKNDENKFILKSHDRQTKLRALSFIYEQYLARMQEAKLYDFDDMILRVVHAMEIFNELRFNLQEKYQYILVDEFQDTNMAQMRILHNLTNNEVQGDTPNIMVVGDDDQAIYSFQGAEVSNILNFQKNYQKAKVITLTENYRSTHEILKGSRNIITQGENRLENILENIDKKLNSNKKESGAKIDFRQADTISIERNWLINDIQEKIKSGQNPNNIAVLTRRHKEIVALLPYFSKAGIAVNYERQDNILDLAPIVLIEKLSRLLISLAAGKHDEVNAELPEILSHKAWGIEPIKLWKLSIKAYNSRKKWLETMSESPEFMPIHNWLITTASTINDTPLEQILDIIVGKPDPESENSFISPFYNYFFSDKKLKENPNEYLIYLESLKTIRSKLREYHPDQTPTLQTFIDFITLNRKIGNTISAARQIVQSDNAINIMTVHKSKGLEFNTVYVVNAVDSMWGSKSRGHNRLVSYPENLQLAPAGETDDERLRLFYVAITRAKKQLTISYSLSDDNGKKTVCASFLADENWNPEPIIAPQDTESLVRSAELNWYQPLIEPKTTSMRNLLLPTLENYKLSVTHLHAFLDVSRGGPATFLLNNLLRFPSAKTPHSAYGTAMHDTLQHAHSHFVATGKKQAVEDIIAYFELSLTNQRMAKLDYNVFLQKGINALQIFLKNNYNNFSTSQKTELDFANQHVVINKANLTGKLDLVDINQIAKTFIVTDYKTGKPSLNWNGKNDYEKIKLHKYKQQLLFYKILVENSRDYHNYKVESGIMQFIEPTPSDENIALDLSFGGDEIAEFSKLINAVWNHIIKLDLPDISKYEPNYKGILAFETDLLNNYE